uniref:Pepsin-I3 domain-containing protein n=2 Tax=Bursaphelenchus xylophilus TaxID=6326 RepID=A0A1I7RQ36_BURXY
MKYLILLSFCGLALSQPVKRFAGFGISTVGGNLGCVVTGNRLFVNGLEGRELTADEQKELTEYQGKLTTFREELRNVMEQRKAELEARRSGAAVSSAKPIQTPEPPKKPSFCSEQTTTQYIFDGCKVQNNMVYVGSTFARKLTESEIEDLKQFDKEMTAYQKSVSASLESQLGELFGAAFAGQTQIARATPEPVTTSSTPVAPPKTPNFCTLIV